MLCKLHCPKPDSNGVMAVAAGAAIAAAPVGAVVWVVTATPFLPVFIGVVCAACVAGIGVVVWEVRRNWGTLWKPPRAIEAHAEDRAIHTDPQSAVMARPALILEAPVPVLDGVVVGRVAVRQDGSHGNG